jgi:hypothetical protein
MRVNASDGDTFKVWLDGQEISACCIEADSDHGWVECFVDEQGRPATASNTVFDNDQPRTGFLVGRVVIQRTAGVIT